jgi:dihydroxy-acid dehydratase
MHVMAEALGITLSGTTPIRAGSKRLFDCAKRAGARIVQMIHEQLLPRQILTAPAFRNAVTVAVAIGASVNVVRHLAAIATEAEIDLDVTGLFEDISGNVPQITQIRPNGPDRIEHFDAAGGTQAVLRQLQEKLHLDVKTAGRSRLGDSLRGEVDIDEKVIRPLSQPFRSEPGLIVLRGNLAPEGAIVKLSAVSGAIRRFSGPARIFEDEESAIEGLSKNAIKAGGVVILRMMGPVGGPGTVFACGFMAAVVGAGLADSVAVVTDGELSGLNRGITVGQVMPEAVRGGPLAIVRRASPYALTSMREGLISKPARLKSKDA